jgi:thymidylate synthase
MYGLTPLIVNLLANPYNWRIFILSATKQDEVAGACQCFYDLQENFNKQPNGYIPVSLVKGLVDKVVPQEALEKVLDNLDFVEMYTEVQKLVEDVRTYGNFNVVSSIQSAFKQYAEPIFLEIPKPEPLTLPGDLSGHLVKGQTVAEVWLKAIALIRSTGRLTDSQYGERQELIQMTSVVYNEPAEFHFEPWLPVTKDFMKEYIPQMCYKDLPKEVSYTYGSRIRNWQYKNNISLVSIDQLTAVASKLVNNQDSSQCTISLWNVETDTFSKSPPCLTNIWVKLVDKRLIMIATFRSHDVYTAYPSNVMALRELQSILLNILYELSNEMLYNAGELIINSQSAHIYSHSFQHTDDVLKQHYKLKVEYNDPVGNFVIESKGFKIVVTQTTPLGEAIKEYESPYPLKLVRQITAANPGINPAHIGYLGIELEKACRLGLNYKQDSLD